ncbi:MAG: helix-turn-helix transcriptional regulator [Clostridia bacterium]|nr:helix-turn-helix transcriptional regulator [Clostridia bacterium]
MSTGEILKTLRGTRTQSDMASELGITKSSWAMYEKDERVPRDEVKILIANYFKKTVQEIFFAHQEHK